MVNFLIGKLPDIFLKKSMLLTFLGQEALWEKSALNISLSAKLTSENVSLKFVSAYLLGGQIDIQL